MYCDVLVELSNFNIDKTFTYKIPFNLKVLVGCRVLVPFSTQKLEGFVLKIKDSVEDDYDIKEIIDVVDSEPILNSELLTLGKKISYDTVSTLISSYQVMLPKALKANHKVGDNTKYVDYVIINNDTNELTSKQEEVMSYLRIHKKVLYSELKKINSSVDTLLKKDIVKKVKEEYYRYQKEEQEEEKFTLTEEQESVVNKVCDNLNSNNKYLLFGVTGSGKTICYMEIIDKVIKEGKQALLLVPEITLTTQIEMRFRKHCETAKRNNFKYKSYLYNAMNELGIENFYVELLESQVENYNEREQFYIKDFNTLCPNGYNLAAGGDWYPHLNGVEHHNAKITNLEELETIYDELQYSTYTLTEIANIHNVSFSVIQNINSGDTYYNSNLIYPLKQCILTKSQLDRLTYDNTRNLLKKIKTFVVDNLT